MLADTDTLEFIDELEGRIKQDRQTIKKLEEERKELIGYKTGMYLMLGNCVFGFIISLFVDSPYTNLEFTAFYIGSCMGMFTISWIIIGIHQLIKGKHPLWRKN